ncbi:hypothetical protein HIM_06429 [Hirsutella minnesotensis 3608]|uniref:DNA (cytosine-5)-methyltransferase 1 replication foci domain-containing protein n=1 Tax=Hirsutella minnesotensis 3608 TaxID=1043627 RepID=A0A0F7ZU40_9HYPO|nr:hypothetical protein HIM_06429 [Hirsutella minnesotensis 3608]
MVGRSRRASTSSVESVDESQVRWLQETSVLRHVPKDLPNDNWPIFELRDAIVLNRDGETVENALHVGVRGPFTVRGTLIIDDPSQKAHLIMRAGKATRLEIRQCVSYSIGEAADGSPIIWVSGRGGWYEINPSAAYRFTYRKMCEATKLYYNLLDIYSTLRPPKKSKKHKNADPMDELSSIFLKYAARVGDGCTFEEVVARCSEHAGFFISQSLHETIIDWKPTAFYKWLTSEHADLLETIEELAKNPRKQSPVPSIDTLSPRPRDSASVTSIKGSSADRAESKRAASIQTSRATAASHAPASAENPRSHNIKHAPAPQPGKPKEPTERAMPLVDTAEIDDQSPFATLVDAIDSMYDVLAATKRGLTTSGMVGKLYFAYTFPQYRDNYKMPVMELLHYNAASLLQHLDQKKYGNNEFYSFLQELSTVEFRPVAYKLSDFPVRITPRRKVQRVSKKDALPATAAPTPPVVTEDQDGALSEDAAPPSRGKGLKRDGRKPGRKSYLRPASSSRKRAHSQLESDSEPEAPGLQNSHYFSDGDDVMQDAPEVEEPQNAETHETEKPAHKGTPIKIVIRAERIPSSTPKGPDETWTCDQDGCSYIVRGGDEAECQARIREHFQDHEQHLERVSLAVTESRGHMPIKYAYFPPFLILVHFEPPTPAQPIISRVTRANARLSSSAGDNSSKATGGMAVLQESALDESFVRESPPPDLSRPAREAFHDLVQQFRRRPHPVSDRIHLTRLQSFTRQDQAHGRQGQPAAAASHERDDASSADQTEADSMTVVGD